MKWQVAKKAELYANNQDMYNVCRVGHDLAVLHRSQKLLQRHLKTFMP